MSYDGKYFIVEVGEDDSMKNSVHIADLEKINYQIKSKLELIPVITKIEADYEVCIFSSYPLLIKVHFWFCNAYTIRLSGVLTCTFFTTQYVANNEKTFVFYTDKDADNYKLVTIDIGSDNPKSPVDLVPEDKKYALQSAQPVYKYLSLTYQGDAKVGLFSI